MGRECLSRGLSVQRGSLSRGVCVCPGAMSDQGVCLSVCPGGVSTQQVCIPACIEADPLPWTDRHFKSIEETC